MYDSISGYDSHSSSRQVVGDRGGEGEGVGLGLGEGVREALAKTVNFEREGFRVLIAILERRIDREDSVTSSTSNTPTVVRSIFQMHGHDSIQGYVPIST